MFDFGWIWIIIGILCLGFNVACAFGFVFVLICGVCFSFVFDLFRLFGVLYCCDLF